MFSPSSNINLCHSIFFDRVHLRSNMAIISGPGSFAVQFGDHLRSGIICGSIWGSFAVQFGDHLRFNLGIICDPGIICGSIWGSFAVRDHLRSWDHLRSGIICGPVQYLFIIDETMITDIRYLLALPTLSSFLDVLLSKQSASDHWGSFITSIYRKKTYTGLLLIILALPLLNTN